MSFLPVTWAQIAIFAVCTPYSLFVFFLFLHKIREPSIKERFPYLVLISAISGLLIILLNTLPCFIFQSSRRDYEAMRILCIIQKIKDNLLWWLVIVPIIIRAYKFLKVKKIVEKFSRNQNADCLLQYSYFYNVIITVSLLSFQIALTILLVLVVETILQCIDLDLQVFSLSELNPTCRYISKHPNDVFGCTYMTTLFAFHLLAAIVQLIILVYFVFQLRGIKAKYNINMELQNICIIWNFQQIVCLVVTALPFSPYNDSYMKIVESLGCMSLITVTILIPLLQMKRYQAQKHSKGCQQLSEQFPQALFFWTPNHYYDKFLRRKYPTLVPYRPLLADILRFDYQITDYLDNYSLIQISQQQTSHDSKFKSAKQMLLECTSKQNCFHQIYNLAVYMNARYMCEESQWYCRFEDASEIGENIKERLKDVRAHLNEYLFEFTRTYLEDKLKPSYDEFLGSPQARLMNEVIKSGEIFEWLLSQKLKF